MKKLLPALFRTLAGSVGRGSGPTRKLIAAALTLGALLLPLLLSDPAPKGPLLPHGVVEVVDGDTIVLPLDGERTRVRYLLMDTPELHHPSRVEEELGPDAKEANRALLASGALRLEFDKERYDKYGRTLAYIWVSREEGEILINEELVRMGLALPMLIAPNGKYAPRVFAAMEEAASKKAGLWGLAEGRVFTAPQVWSETAALAGTFVTVKMTLDKVERKGRRIFLTQGRVSAAAYKDPYTEGLLSLKKGDKIIVKGKVLPSATGCEIPVVSSLQVSKYPDG